MVDSNWWLSQHGNEVRRSSAKAQCHGIQSQMMEHMCLKSPADVYACVCVSVGGGQSQSHFWIEILSKQMLTGRLHIHSKVRRHKHLTKPSIWQLDTEDILTRLLRAETGTQTITTSQQTQYFSHSPIYIRITLPLSLASDLLISLFVKMTLAASISLVPVSLRAEVSYPPLSSSGRGEGISLWLLWQPYLSIFMTSLISQVY